MKKLQYNNEEIQKIWISMKRFLKRMICGIIVVVALVFALSWAIASSSTYNPPEGYTEKHHTYEEIVAFARTLDPDAKVSEKYTDTTIDAWNRKFREWDAEINGMKCHVSSVGDMVWNSGFLAGEFASQYYVIDTDYDYLLLQKIVSEKQPDWEMEYTAIDSRYNWNNLLNVKTPYAEDKELSEEELEIAWAQAYEIYQEYTSYPVRKEAWFPVSIPLKRADADGKGAYITFSILVMKDFSAEGKKQFFKDYTEAWNLMDSGLPVKK